MKIRLFFLYSFTILCFIAGTEPIHGEETILSIDAGGLPIIRAQSPAEKPKPSLTIGERFKKLFSFHHGDEPEAGSGGNDPVKTLNPAITIRPPKPPTGIEVKQAVENPERPLNSRRPAMTETLNNTHNAPSPAGQPRLTETAETGESVDSIYQRMQDIRTQIFEKSDMRESDAYQQELTRINHPNRQPVQQDYIPFRQTPATTERLDRRTPPPLPFSLEDEHRPLRTTDIPLNSLPAQTSVENVLPYKTAPLTNIDAGTGVQNITEKIAKNTAGNNKDGETLPEPIRVQRTDGENAPSENFFVASRRVLPNSNFPTEQVGGEKKVLISPRVEVSTEGPPRVVVGQEALYKIKVANRGDAPAEQVVLTIEIPDWLQMGQPDVSDGQTSLVPRGDGGEKVLRDFLWKISRIEPNKEEFLVLHIVPQKRQSVDLRIKYDFFRPQTVAKIVVQEPVIEMELQGPDEVVWGSKIQYKLVVRNTGNGDAENVMLELLQTGSDMRTCPLPLLKAGEEQPIEVLVWTGKQEHIDINIQASGEYGLKTKVNRRIRVLRPSVQMTVESPSVQFVGFPAEFQIKVQNNGDAPASEVLLSANLPLGSQFVSCTGNGELTPENKIVWKLDTVPVGDKFNATVICTPKREGNCKMDIAVCDKGGILAQCSGTMEAQAIVDLKLDIEYPQGPIAVGREAVYTIKVTNRGTKTAENIAIISAFADGLEPISVEGGNAYMNDGQVFFDKITTITTGQTVSLKIKAKADKAGNHRVRTTVACSAVNVNLVNEQATYFYKIQKDKSRAFASSEPEDLPSSAQKDIPVMKTENGRADNNGKEKKSQPELRGVSIPDETLGKRMDYPSVIRPIPQTELESKQEPVIPEPVKPEADGPQAPFDPSKPLPQVSDPFLPLQ